MKRGGMRRVRTWLWQALKWAVLIPLGYLALCAVLLLAYRFVDPPVTGVQVQRWVEATREGTPYSRRYVPVDASQMALALRRAVVVAEDGRFYEHDGVDWDAIQRALEANQRAGRVRQGGSTITQQLVKNLFFTTHRSYLRKGAEIPLAYAAEFVLPKERILTLYLNVIEWGPGIYGAEAAAQHHFGRSASVVTRRQAASMAALIPNPRRRTPAQMHSSTDTILQRLRQHGW